MTFNKLDVMTLYLSPVICWLPQNIDIKGSTSTSIYSPHETIKNSPDQKIVGNSLQPIGVIIIENLFSKASMLRVTIDVIGQCG